MRNIRLYILLLLLAPFWFTAIAQFDPSSISRIENGKLQFTLDNSWSESQKKEVQKLFNLDSTIWIQLKNRNSQIVMDNVNWNVKYISGNIAVISKSLEKLPVSHLNINDIFLIDEHWEV
ncbi:MAG: hypothetical protein H6540_09545, partial [Bacteroidales bacterium]|nr:hypothetical protein [Bacteroidales bacterium]